MKKILFQVFSLLLLLGSSGCNTKGDAPNDKPLSERWIPTLRIYTENEAEVTSRESWTTVTRFVLTDPNNPENNITETNPRNQIRGRGNTTWLYPKRSYRVRFRENTSLFGLRAHRNWILLAEFLDPTFLTTAVAFELGQNVFNLPFTNSYFHVHVYINGRYDGIYILTEHRQAAPDNVGAPGRAEIHPTKGWFVELDIGFDEPPKFRTQNFNLPVLIKIPTIFETRPGFPSNTENSDDPFFDFIRNDWNQLTDLMVCTNFPENGYRDLIDMETFVDFLMINEIVLNAELGHPKSVFAYKNTAGRIALGPIWDFDWAFSMQFDAGGSGTHHFFAVYTGLNWIHPFFRRFFEDPVFVEMYRNRWNEKFPKVLNIANFIEEKGRKLQADVARDTERWLFDGGYRPGYPTNYLAEIARMRTWWINRVNWLNAEINRW